MNRRRLALSVVVLVLVALPVGVSAGTPNDLDRRARTTIRGATQEESVGTALAAAGDVNGDGVPDLLVRRGLSFDGSAGTLAYVVFGGSPEPLDLAELGDRGFEITTSAGSETGDLRSYELTGVAAAGDLNADGFDDVIIGIPWTDHDGRRNSGSAYVIYGKSDPDPVDVMTLGTGGVTIYGADRGDEAGAAVGSADVDGDGLNDVLVGAPYAGSELPNPGKVHVVLGSSLQQEIDLAGAFGGFSVEGPRGKQRFGAALADAGDMDGDGRHEIVIGAPGDPYRIRSGAYVVFGSSVTADIDLAGEWEGWEIHPRRRSDLGYSVAGGADFNGDSIPDVLLGDPDALDADDWDSGAAYVVFGTADGPDVLVNELGTAGVKIDRGGRLAKTGHSVAFVPDQDGDGRAEAAVGSINASDFGEYEAGRVDIVPGRAGTDRIDLRDAPEVATYVGFASENAGASLAFAGDFTGSGEALVAVGAPDATFGDSYYQGIVYLVPAVMPHNDLPPRATLLSYSARQRGDPGSYCWDGVCADRMPAFPPAEKGSIRNMALIRLGTSERPADTVLTYYREVDEFGRPAGRARQIDHRVRPIQGREGSGYEIRFDLPGHAGDAYLVLHARWEGPDRGDASWFFHLSLNRDTYTDIPGPPSSHLVTGDTRQRGQTYGYQWQQSYVDGTASIIHADAFSYGFPDAKRARHGARAKIRVHDRYRPDRLVIRSYRKVRRIGDGPFVSEYPRGPRRLLDFSWRAVRRDGRVVAHDARFRLPRRGKHAYLEVRGRWRHHGTAPWQFHLRFGD